jgi:hypothetical protein
MVRGMKLATRLPSEAKSQLAHLREQGFCIVRDILQTATAADLSADIGSYSNRTPFSEGACAHEQSALAGMPSTLW